MKANDTTEAERAALHALLFEHRRGLALADVAVELGLSEQRAEELLRAQEARQLVRCDVDEDQGVLRYVTLRVSEPSIGARAALVTLDEARVAARDRTRRERRIALVGVITAVVATAGWFAIRRVAADVAEIVASSAPARTPGAPALPVVTSGDEHAFAQSAFLQQRAWHDEANDLDARMARLDADARANDCAAPWTSGEPCYVSHRLMTGGVFDTERSRMALRKAQLRHLLENR